MLTTGRDNTLRFYEGGAMKQTASVSHNNNTGRWVMPFRASWGPGGAAVCGSMKRAVPNLALLTHMHVSKAVGATYHFAVQILRMRQFRGLVHARPVGASVCCRSHMGRHMSLSKCCSTPAI